MICKGSSKGRRTTIKKNGYNKSVPVKFQKIAWVDTTVVEEIAADFVQHEKGKHGDAWIILALDNLHTHVDDENDAC